MLQPGVLMALLALPFWATSASLPSSPESYLNQAARVRQSIDRPWAPEAGQLGNLRHLQITAPDCVVRIVSGSENRVFPGTRDVVVVERSRVLDTNPNEQPPPRDVLLAIDPAQACPRVGSCGVSITPVRRSTDNFVTGAVCFTVQLATAHDLLLGGDGLSILVDQVRQPALRIRLNPSADLRVWLEQVNIGLLSIGANAPARVGGSGKIDFLQVSSSDGGSRMFLQEFHASQVGISTTTTGTQWAIRIDADTRAGYYQPARAPGPIAKNYGIEIEGLIDHLDVPVGQVDPQPLSEATRIATRALRGEVLKRAGPAPAIPAFSATLPSAKVAAEALSEDPSERVARVVARYLPASIRITKVALWKKGGRLEGMAPDPASAREVARLLTDSGEFTHVGGRGSIPRDGGHAFSVQLSFACEVPGQPSVCPAGDPAASGAYTEAQVRGAIESLLGPLVTVREVRLDGGKIHLKAGAPNEIEAAAALERLSQRKEFFSLSTSMHGRSDNGSSADIRAILRLTCATPPKADGICTSRTPSMRGASAVLE
ncbi:MAG: hypothetical protein WAV67_08085 [Dokdonella sp.]